MVSAVICAFLVFLGMGLVSYVDSECPDDPMHGYWTKDKDNGRCILRCNGGYEPSGCHVIRYNCWTEKWNRDIPTCQKEWPVSGKTLASVGTGVAAVVATPLVIAGVGFTATGVAAGSLAAMLQAPLTAAGGLFALAQSAGVVGTTVATKGAVGAVTVAITYATSSAFSNCEAE